MRNTFKLLLTCCLLITFTYSHIHAFAQTEDNLSTSNELNERQQQLDQLATEIYHLQYGTIENGEEHSLDLSQLVPANTVNLTLVMTGISPAGFEPLVPELATQPGVYWVIQVDNPSNSYQATDAVFKQLQVQEEKDGIFTYVAPILEVTDSSGYTLMAKPHPNPFLLAPNASRLLFIIQPVGSPFSQYVLTSIADPAHIQIPAFEAPLDDLVLQAISTTQVIHTEDTFLETLTKLKTDYAELSADLLASELLAYDDALVTQVQSHRATLNQTLSDELILIEHGLENIDTEQTEAYWIFSTHNSRDESAYASQNLWSLQAYQEFNSYQDPLAFTLTPVLQTPAGNFMPTEQPMEYSLVPSDWSGFFKVSLDLRSASYEFFLDYNGERLDSFRKE